jgi:hypothetical protein
MTLPLYNQAIINKCMINGIDVTSHVRQLYVCASILTPYIVAKLTIADMTQIQDALYESGVPVLISYTAGDSTINRDFELVTMGNMGATKAENNRVGKAEISAISKNYFDLQIEHNSFHQNVPASEVFKKLHKELVPGTDVTVTKTRGLIGDREPFHLRGIKLGKAITNVRNRMTDEKYQSGAYVYYVDQALNYHCKPVLELFETARGPKFFQRVAGHSFLKEQDEFAFNIFSMRQGTSGDNGADNAINYQSALRQRGGSVNEGWDWASGVYTPPAAKTLDTAGVATPGKTSWKGPVSDAPGTVNHKFNYDSNQKTSEDFEVDIANRNLIKALIMQGSTLVNVPLEGGLQSYVGKGVFLDIPVNAGSGESATSLNAGQHLVIAQGEYIFQDKKGFSGVAAIQTSSGGKQGSLV